MSIPPMKEQPTEIIRVLKAFKTENATYKRGEVYGVRPSLAKQFVSRGLVELVKVEEDDQEEEVPNEAAVGPTWNDPELGRLHCGDLGWETRVAVPAFKAFKYRTRCGKGSKTCPLTITAYSPDQLPSADAIALAKRVVANHAALAARVVGALWADFTGNGPNSGMYWHGDLNQVAQGLETRTPPRSAQDLFKLLKPSAIKIRPASRSSKQFLAELNFFAAYEEEHGVGVLTDGLNVLGIGYSGDVTPFKRSATKSKPRPKVKHKPQRGQRVRARRILLKLLERLHKGSVPHFATLTSLGLRRGA